LARAIFGADPIDSGDVIMNGRKLSLKSPSDAIKAASPTSRRTARRGLAVKMQLAENITMANVQEISQRFGVLSRSLEMEAAKRYVKELSSGRPASPRLLTIFPEAISRRWSLQVAVLRFKDSDLRRTDS